MSTYTYKLKGARWLRTWTAADRSSVYAAQSEAQKIADTLCDVPWTRAKSDGPAMFPLTAAKSLDENPANRDLFDAALFCAEHSDGAHRAYANAAMYLFKLPSTSGVNLKSVTVHVESDAYNALGARIAVHLLSSAELPTDCATVRTGAAHAEGVAARRTVERDGRNYWYSNSEDVTITGGTSEPPAAIGELTQYLAVYIGMENYATSRNEWLEGASYIRNLIEIETDGQISNWTNESMYDCIEADPTVLLNGGNSPTWLQPLPTVNAGASAGHVPAGAEVEATFFTSALRDQQQKTAKMNFSITIGPHSPNYAFSFRADIELDLVGALALGGTAHVVAMNEIDGTQTEETIMLLTIGESQYLGFASGVWSAYKVDLTSYYKRLHCYIKLPLVCSLVNESNGEYLVECPLVKWFSHASISCNSTTAEYTASSDGVTGYRQTAYRIVKQLYDISTVYYMLRMVGGVPSFMDACDSPDETARRGEQSEVSGTSPSWTVSTGGVSFGVAVDGRQVTLTQGTSHSWQFTLPPDDEIAGEQYFDASANLRVENASIENYGLAAALGDFSHAVVTFEAGTQPSNAEVLGRLARMSRKEAGDMLYLHPENGALANELDMLRPVPRFFRID